MDNIRGRGWRKRGVWLLLLCCLALPLVAQAQQGGSAMPWEKPLSDISTSMIGPVALAGFLIGLAFFCLMWMCGYAMVGAAIGVVVAGAILANADSVASWIGLGG